MSPAILLLTTLSVAQVWDEAPTVKPQWIGASKAMFRGAPKRIVCLAPSATEFVFALGAGSRVVGVSRFADHPAAVRGLPRVGGFIDPNLEKIIELRPDLVIAVTNAAVLPVLLRLSKFKIPVLAVPGNSFADTFHAGLSIAKALGKKSETRAKVMLREMKRDIENLSGQAQARKKWKVAFVYGHQPLVLAGPGSFADTILGLLNAENIVKIRKSYPSYSLEQVLIDAPEVILDGVPSSHGASRRALDWSKFRSIPAVKTGRVHSLDAMSIFRAGPRIVEAMRMIDRVLRSASHPKRSQQKK
jgi:iron complex transport system substrate-binding protein